MKTIKFNDCEKCGYKLEKCKCKEMTLQQKINEIEKEFDEKYRSWFESEEVSAFGMTDEIKSFLASKLQEIAHFTADELRVEEKEELPIGQGHNLYGFNSALEEIKIKSEELFK